MSNSKFFAQPGFPVSVLCSIVMTFMTIGFFRPDFLRKEYVGSWAFYYESFLLDEYRQQFHGLYRIIITVHAFDSFVALNLAWRKGVRDTTALFKWFLQTLVMGWFSLNLIKSYEPEKKAEETKKTRVSRKTKKTR